MERQVEDYIHGLSDLELLEYTRTATHLPEALEFAQVELAERHLPPDRLTDLEKQLQQRAKERPGNRQRATELGMAHRLFSLRPVFSDSISVVRSRLAQVPRRRRRPQVQRDVGLRGDWFLPPADPRSRTHPTLELD